MSGFQRPRCPLPLRAPRALPEPEAGAAGPSVYVPIEAEWLPLTYV